nr:hypothetical protein [Paenibacillus donghaensis]
MALATPERPPARKAKKATGLFILELVFFEPIMRFRLLQAAWAIAIIVIYRLHLERNLIFVPARIHHSADL